MFRDCELECFLAYLFLTSSLHCTQCQFCPEHTCNWTTSDNFPFPLCYCDPLCHIYEDCCVDVTTTDLESNVNHKTFNSTLLRFDDRNCMTLTPPLGSYGFRVVNKCHGKFCSRDLSMIQSILPVTISTGTTFLNAECARCNGQSDFRLWDILFYKPNEKETLKAFEKKNVTNEEIVQMLLKSKSNLINYKISLSLDDITPPRFCFNLKDVTDTCPKYLSPVECVTTTALERNAQCSQLNSECRDSMCKLPFNPFFHFESHSLYLSVLLKFKQDENLNGENKESYHIKVRNPSVYVFISYISGFHLPKMTVKRFIGALYFSLRHHSGYNLKTFLTFVQYNIFNCTSNDPCLHYHFYLRLLAEITVEKSIIYDFLNKEIKIIYKDTNLGFTSLEANLKVTSSANITTLKRLWFPLYSSFTGTFTALSEMRKCEILSVVATIQDENLTAGIVTKCTKRMKAYGLTAKGGAKCMNMLMTVTITVFISETIF